MKKDSAESKEQFDFYKTLFNFSSIPMGIIGIRTMGQNSDFQLLEANSMFIEISKLKNLSFPIAAQDGFTFLKGFSNSLLNQLWLAPNEAPTKILYQSNECYYRLTLQKIPKQGFSFTLEDITELQQKQIELSDKSRQLRESQEIAQLGYWIENHEMGDNFWSEQVYNLLNIPYKTTPPSFANYLKFVLPEDLDKVIKAYHEAIETKTGFEITHRLQPKNEQVKFVNLRCYTNYNSKSKPSQTIGILQDVTAIENTKEALHKSEIIFRSIFEYAPIAIVLVNSNFNLIYANPQFCDITGYSMDEILKKDLKEFTYAADFEYNIKQYTRLFDNEVSTFSLTKRYVKKNGEIIWVKIIVSALKDTHHKTTSAIVMLQDISAEKKAAEALLKSEYRYRTLIENANDGIGLFDLDFKPIIYNTVLYEMLGYTFDDYMKIDHNKFELFHPDDIHLGQEAIKQLNNNSRAKIEARLKNADGSYQFFSITYIPVLHEDKPAKLIFRRDISKRKMAEQQNEEYRLFLETIMDNLPVLFFVKTTPDFRYLYWNHAAEQITGISADNAIGKTDFEIYQSKQIAEKYFHEDEKLIKSRKRLDCEHEFTNSLGEVKHFKTIKTLYQSQTGAPLILGLSMDITQLKKAEQQIEQSTQMLKEAQKIARLGYWEYNVEKDLFFDNLENRQILGTDKFQYFLSLQQFIKLLNADEQNEVIFTFKNSIATNTPGEGVLRIQVNNETKFIAINYRPVINAKNEVIKLRGTCLDITHIRRNELALVESEKRLKQAEHIAKVGYWDHNYITKTTYFSNEVWNILELSSNTSNIRFSDFIDTIHPEDKSAASVQFQKSTQNNQPFDFDFRIITHNHNTKYIKAIGTFVKNSQGILQQSIGTFQDVTDIRRNELELKKNSDHLIEIQKLSKTGYIEIYFQSNKTVFSSSIFDILEIQQTNQITLPTFNEFILPDDRVLIEKTIHTSSRIKNNHNIQYRLLLPNGTIKFIHEICHITPANQVGEEYATLIIHDITKIKEKEFELTRWSEIKKTAAIGSWEFVPSTLTYSINSETCAILELNENETKVTLEQWLQMIHPEDKYSIEVILKDSFLNHNDFTLSYRIISPINRSIKYIQDASSFFNSADGQYNLIGTIRDITTFRQTEQRLMEQNELLKAISANSVFSMAIIYQNKHIYVNNRWSELIGLPMDNSFNSMDFNQIYKPDTILFFQELFINWANYEIKEYRNEMLLKPLNAPDFYADIYVKEIVFKHSPAFLVLLNPQAK